MQASCTRVRCCALVMLAVTSGGAPLSRAQSSTPRLDSLGEPTIPIAQGSGVIAGGTGLATGSGAIELAVPDGAVVKQALLYWSGMTFDAGVGDADITVDDVPVHGQLIGGPTYFYFLYSHRVYSWSYRADVTDLALLEVGSNSLSIDSVTFNYQPTGAGLLAIIDDGTPPKDIHIRDGNDVAFYAFSGTNQFTNPQTVRFVGSFENRQAELTLLVGDFEPGQTHSSVIAVQPDNVPGSLIYSCELNGSDGAFWDTYVNSAVPLTAGATGATVVINSQTYFADPDCRAEPGSLVWVAMALVIPRSPEADCDGNYFPDVCDLSCLTHPQCPAYYVPCGRSADCNADLTPDSCEIAAGSSGDCDLDAVPNECEIAAGSSADCNTNGIPDECERVDPVEPFRWQAEAGLWSDDANWCPDLAPSNGDGIAYDVLIAGASAVVRLDVSVLLRTLVLIAGATLQVAPGARSASGEALAAGDIFNDGIVEALGGETLVLSGHIVQSGGGVIRAIDAGSAVVIDGADTTVRGGTLAAIAQGRIELAGSTAEDILLQDQNGTGIFLSSNGVVANALVESLTVADRNRGVLVGTIENVGTIAVRAVTGATSLLTATEAPHVPMSFDGVVRLRGPGELLLVENPPESAARVSFGDIAVPLVNSNGHTIAGTGRIDASDFRNEGSVLATGEDWSLTVLAGLTTNQGLMRVAPGALLTMLGDFQPKVANEGAILVGENGTLVVYSDFSSQTRNLGKLDAADGALLVFFGDVSSQTLESQITVDGDARLELFGDLVLDDSTRYFTSNGAESVAAALAADSLLVTAVAGPDQGAQMELSGEMSVRIQDLARVRGAASCNIPPRGSVGPPPKIKLTDAAQLHASALDIIRSGVVDASGSATVQIYGAVTLDMNGALIGTSGSPTILAGDIEVTGTVPCSGRLILGGDAELVVEGDLVLDSGVPLRGVVGPILKTIQQASAHIGGSLIMIGGPDVAVSSALPMVLAGDFVNQSYSPEAFDWGSGSLTLSGGSRPQVFEVGGSDAGGVAAAWVDNFALGTLEVSSAAAVTFTNAFANVAGDGACAEALYADTLVLRAGASVTLEDVRVYCRTLMDEGATIVTAGCGGIEEVHNGDHDGDGILDLMDLAAFDGCMAGPRATALGGMCRVFDFDSDQDLDLADFAAFMRSFAESDPR